MVRWLSALSAPSQLESHMQTSQLLIFGLVLVAMWFLLIRPQQQRQKQHKQTVSALAPGQRVVTIGGLVAEIVEVRGDRLLVRVADGSEMEYVKDAVGRVLRDDEFVDEFDQDADADEDADLDGEAADDTQSDAPPAPPLPPQADLPGHEGEGAE